MLGADGWYDYFGLRHRDYDERLDRLSVMQEFLRFLTVQEEVNAGYAAAVGSLHKAQRDFIERQVLPRVEAAVGKLETGEPRYQTLLRALRAFLVDELVALEP